MRRAVSIGVILAGIAAYFAGCHTEPRAAWKPVEGRIMTRWAGHVIPERALPEHPRPQMVRPDWANLNGLWDYAIIDRNAGRPEEWDGKILVPFAVESALSGVGRPVGADKELWYRRELAVPRKWRGRRVLLHFGAVDWACEAWVNGRQVGTHKGGFDPFSQIITAWAVIILSSLACSQGYVSPAELTATAAVQIMLGTEFVDPTAIPTDAPEIPEVVEAPAQPVIPTFTDMPDVTSTPKPTRTPDPNATPSPP
ncbi:MAG: hypothetical protein R6X21_01670, partial [Candidatus Aminicenantes bacterium]